MRTAVILSGGGAKSAYEAGVLRALEDNNVRVDLVIGTSAGALNAVLYAVGETERLYNGQGTGLWQRISKKAILRNGLLSTFYSRVVSWKLAWLAIAVSILNLVFFALGFSLIFLTGYYVSFKNQGISKATGRLGSNFLTGIFYGLVFLAVVMVLEYLFVGRVVLTVYHWLKIKLGIVPVNDESLNNLRVIARHIPRMTKKVLTRWLKLPPDVLDTNRLLESIQQVDAPAYFSSRPLEEMLGGEIQRVLSDHNLTASRTDSADIGLTFTTWLHSKVEEGDPRFRELMITATDLNAKTECLFLALRDQYREQLVTQRLKRYDLNRSDLFVHSQGIDHCGPDYIDLLYEENGCLLIDALLASTSIIGVFPPRKIKMPDKGYWRSVEPPHTFVDGGFGNNTPIRDAIEAGATHLVVVQVEPKNVVEPLNNPEELNATLPCLMRTVETVLDTTVDDDYRYYELWNKYAPKDERVRMSIVQPRSSLCIATLDFDGGISASGNKVPLSAACARGYSDALKQFIYTDWPRWKEEIQNEPSKQTI
ncbi:MAG: patatin-like phospholipase family protein [Terriglobia bacterium]